MKQIYGICKAINEGIDSDLSDLYRFTILYIDLSVHMHFNDIFNKASFWHKNDLFILSNIFSQSKKAT